MEYKNLLSPMKINKYTFKNRIVSAPMVFSLVALTRGQGGPVQQDCSQGQGRGGRGLRRETDVNFLDANRVRYRTAILRIMILRSLK